MTTLSARPPSGIRRFGYMAALLALALAVPAHGAEEERNEEPHAAEAGELTLTEGVIEAGTAQRSDAEIGERLRGLYEVLPRFRGVEVEVSEGVVILSGVASEPEVIAQAENLAARTDGTVLVENRIVLDTSLDNVLGPAVERAQSLGDQAIAMLPLILIALVVVLGFWLLGLFLGRRERLWRRLMPNELLANLAGFLVPPVFAALGLVIALNLLDAVAVLSAVLGAAGVAGLAVGFAVRDSIENFVASVMLSLRQPFRPNDLVDVDGRLGNVVRLTSRATILMTPDGNHIRIPNAQVFKAVIVNYTRNAERRITFDLGIDADDDAQQAIATGVDALRDLPFVLADPAPQGWIREVGDSNIVLTFAPWIDQREADYVKSCSAAILTVKLQLEAAGFTLPEPVYRLRFDRLPEGAVPASTAQPRPETGRPRPEPARVRPEAIDTAPDHTIEERVAQDRASGDPDDLLSTEAPTEFGDRGGSLQR